MVLLAGSVDVEELLRRLAQDRPVFHSEADLQHAVAWTAHAIDPDLQVRLETHPEPHVRLDLAFFRNDIARSTAMELKYLTSGWSGEVSGEQFALKNHGAQDIRAYDVVKDMARLERFVAGRPDWNGVLLCIANDPMYWRAVTHGRATNADAFRVYDGKVLAGERAWGPKTGHGTMKGRADPIVLRGEYRLEWRDYATVVGSRGQFRYLLVEVSH